MTRPVLLVALQAFLALAPHAAGGAPPEVCREGSFVVEGGPLLPGTELEGPDRVVLEAGTLALASGCPPVAFEARAGRRGTWLRARWAECSGLAERVKLKARIGRGCNEMEGRLRIASPPLRRRFVAAREVSAPECDVAHPCPAGELCELPVGVCASALDRGTCVAVPSACPDVYDPVCGCDGQTYGNDCERRAAGVSKASDGACKTCPPVCGCDARDREGLCPLFCRPCRWVCDTRGCSEHCDPVPRPGGCEEERRCGTILGLPCEAGELCELPPGSCGGADLEGTCEEIPEACLTVWDPVCGCDGKTYGNDCERRRAQVMLAHEGSCEDRTPCGPVLSCDGRREICVAKEPVGPAIVYACERVPEGCEDDRSCACAGSALCTGAFDTCSETGANAISCECLECQ